MRKTKTAYWLSVTIAILFLLVFAQVVTLAQEKTKFYLVGVGPGDPDLITLRAVNVIKEADLIFCHKRIKDKFAAYLKGKKIFNKYWRLFPYYGEDCSKLEGKQRRECEKYHRRQNEFVEKVRKAIAQGKTVAMLDNGDALMYGPCSWCLEELEDLNPVVVPGLSSFNAANAALRKDVPEGEHTKSIIITADDWPGKTDTIVNLSRHQATMVIFTMKAEFEELIKKLSINYPPETPIAIVEYAGYAEKERVIRATLETILDKVKNEKLPFEYLLYVGDFLTYREKKVEKE